MGSKAANHVLNSIAIIGLVGRLPRARNSPAIRTGRQPDIADWFYVPSWRRSPLLRIPNLDELKKQKQCWLVFTSKNEFGSELVRNLEQQGQEVISVVAGTRFAKLSGGTYTIEVQNRSHYSALLKEIATLETPPQQVIHLWSLDARSKRQENGESFQRTQAQSFYSLLFLAQALDEFKMDQDLDLTVVSDSVQEVTGEELLSPEKAMVLGPSRVLPQEYPNITYRSIDVVLLKSKDSQRKLVKQVIADIVARSSDTFVAYRGQHRWTQSFEPLPVTAPGAGELRLSEGGLYLIAGGLNDLNLELAELLAYAARAKVLLAGRFDEASRRAEKLKEIEAAGGEIVCANVDAADGQQLRETIADAQQRFGPLKGIFFNPNTAREDVNPVRSIDAEKCSARLWQTAHELASLGSLTEETELDFCVLISSLSTIVGGHGEIVSAAANHIVDSFAQTQKQNATGYWMSVNLDLKHLRRNAGSPSKLRITRNQAAEVLRRVLSLNTISQVAVSTIDLRERLSCEKASFRRKSSLPGSHKSACAAGGKN
jgi:NAD(P)-dependent dehydrogenase (short-subunit alcohol dehydrogenase family)